MALTIQYNLADLSAGWILTISCAVPLTYIVGSTLLAYFSPRSRYLRSQSKPAVGDEKDNTLWFLPSSIRAGLNSIKYTRDMVFDGYHRFSSSNLPFALPQIGASPMLLLPQSSIKPLMQKSDDEVDLQGVLVDITAAKYTGDTDIIVDNPLHLEVIKHQLTRKLPMFTEAVCDELVRGLREEWGEEGDWKSIKVWGSCMSVISRGANRVFSGEELCREKEFLKATRDYAQGIFATAGMINLAPRWLRPVVGRGLGSRNQRFVTIAKKYAIPIIEKRLEEFRAGKREEGHDALDWIIEEAMHSKDPSETSSLKLCRRLMRLNMVAIHTTSFTITNTILDLYSSPRAEEFVEGLREEVSRVMTEHGGKWNKQAVNDLVRVDSAIKESMRLSSFLTTGLARDIKSAQGVNLGHAAHVPAGVRVGFPVAAIHLDPQYYSNPEEYDAFCFAEKRSALNQKSDALENRRQGVVSTGETFLAFGHGRHSCPGRFFAAQEMKLMLAYILMNYDVKLAGKRPNSVFLGGSSLPDPSAEILVRKRVEGRRDSGVEERV